jgi:hypothetical protein
MFFINISEKSLKTGKIKKTENQGEHIENT